jgi:hypothetical protein
MKKALVILLAFALVFGLVFAACSNGTTGGNRGGGGEGEGEGEGGGGGGGGGPTEEVVIFNMQDSAAGTVKHKIQELTAGALDFSNKNNPILPLVKAGNMKSAGEADDHLTSFDAVTVDGKIALKYVTNANWGPGFDLPNSAFGFLAGDKITITGTATGSAIDLALNVDQGGAQNISGGNRITTTGDFTVELILKAEDIPVIAKNQQKVIRFEDRKGSTTVTIYNVVIVGQRPSEIKKLAAPVIAIEEGVISWTAVTGAGGYKVFALADGGTEAEEVTSLVDVVSYNLTHSDLEPGDYKITVVALGVAGSSTDSDPSNPVDFTKSSEVIPAKITITTDADFDYAPGDGPANPGGVSLKGNIKAAISAEINSYEGGQVWLYWVFVNEGERGNSYGIGSFGGENYSTPATGPTAEGIVKITIPSGGFTLGGDDNDCIVLNPYNACAIIKIEVYE